MSATKPIAAADVCSSCGAVALDDVLDPASGPLRDRRQRAMRNLRKLAAERTKIDEQIAANVGVARTLNSAYYDYGAPTWAEIGEALGVTKQAAQSRYGRTA